ncbi:cell envelope integrity protein TolA [Salmonella enterica]|uniref:Protein TolA n=1 Tax=Salmonella enterica subsp. enterica serovar Rough O:d:1,7 TaxID=1974323 RepID=A0A974KDK2_SALET|nr:cell envelope integrity protein TolA [Salmonella enterica subsp. enterica serovar Florida]EIQ6926353.1 cell envelope integrity protein TolA [Salmonella enterica]OSD64248.1 protein TolA [Salmonella enterica subsp. enterica serovar Rough O:d:1,7]ECF4168041.1 cell envelope integrity protein TolA [Salmonella enterica subsp. enterica serovar Florida]ECW2476707.1 cell envelope integrity protein TolA [Salmonella enterica subsp. enterica serovar Florida]
MDSSDAKCKAGSQLLLSVVIALSMTGGVKADSAVKPVPPAGKVSGMFVAHTPATGEEIRKYALQIRSAIESNFYDIDQYTGKQCVLRIRMAPDGVILNIKSEGGDPALCRAAMKAARKAEWPRPPSPAVYNVFKKAVLDFRL